MKKLIPLLALLLYSGVSFRFPEQISMDKLPVHAAGVMEKLGKVNDALRPLLAQMIATEENEDTRQIYMRIENATKREDIHGCNKLEPIPAYENAPSIGDWIAYCLARIKTDERRCEQIDATIKPALRDLCLRELSQK